MGTSLIPVGNHNIQYKGRNFQDIASEIKEILNHCKFPNSEFLRTFALRWYGEDDTQMIRKIDDKREWTFFEENEYFTYDKSKQIEFEGPFTLGLSFYESQIVLDNPPYRYWQWFELKDAIARNEWRKYMQCIITALGGDRVIYLADNGTHLEEFMFYDGSFEELEQALFNKLGAPKTTFEAVAADFDNAYFIDNFKTIDNNSLL